MPLYMIEREFAEELELSSDDVEPSPEAIITAARRADVPADKVVEVGPGTVEFSDRLRDWAEAQAAAS